MDETVTFSFGENWKDFVRYADERVLQDSLKDIEKWLGLKGIKGKRILDVGCGSGIHSLCFSQMEPEQLVSFDYDPHSVTATKQWYDQSGKPPNWTVMHGSVLDVQFLNELGLFDVVYSWGVLHHTGAMWEAIANAATRVTQGGILWIALYYKGPSYSKHLELKRRYNSASPFGKKIILYNSILEKMWRRLKKGKNPFTWYKKKGERGMKAYHDLIDWLGGLPYEVASVQEVQPFLEQRGFVLERVEETHEGHNDVYLFRKS